MSRAFGQALQTAGAGLFQITQSQGANKLQEVNMTIEQNRQAMLDRIRNSTQMLEGMQSMEASNLAREKFQFTKDEAARIAALPDWDKTSRPIYKQVAKDVFDPITQTTTQTISLEKVGEETIYIDKKTLGEGKTPSIYMIDQDGKFTQVGGSIDKRVDDSGVDKLVVPPDMGQDDTLGEEGLHFKTRADARKHYLAEYARLFPDKPTPSSKYVDGEITKAIKEGSWSIGSSSLLPDPDKGGPTKVTEKPITKNDVGSVNDAQAKVDEAGKLKLGRTGGDKEQNRKVVEAKKELEKAKERDPEYLVPLLKAEKAEIEASLAKKGPPRSGGARRSQLARLNEINKQLAKLEPLLPAVMGEESLREGEAIEDVAPVIPGLPEARQFMPDDGMGANTSLQTPYISPNAYTLPPELGPQVNSETQSRDVPVYPEQRGHNVIGYGPGGLGDIPPRQGGLITQEMDRVRADAPYPAMDMDWTKVRASQRPGHVKEVSPYERGGDVIPEPAPDIYPSMNVDWTKVRASQRPGYVWPVSPYDRPETKTKDEGLVPADPGQDVTVGEDDQGRVSSDYAIQGLIQAQMDASASERSVEKALSEWGASIGSMKKQGLDDTEIRQILMKTLTQLSMGIQDESGNFKPGTALPKDHPLVQSLGMILQETNFDSF